ncbi:hypothetical protein Gorai_003448 [Gossypium raimondii]|uniref:Uncharacterized protein n=1 Tax=Gossypium raimondii TaxID=29730 RepID=A0A7J8QPB9_GOSRA|nr:hypothetical protein [Gossypium raimondii]
MSCWHAALRSGFFEQKLLRKTGKATTRKGRGSHKAMLDLEISVLDDVVLRRFGWALRGLCGFGKGLIEYHVISFEYGSELIHSLFSKFQVVTIRGGFDKGPSQPTAILWAYSFCI